MKVLWIIIYSIFFTSIYAQKELEYISKNDVKFDLSYLDSILQETSSYQGLNGYHYKADFDEFYQSIRTDSILKNDFGLFLSKSIGKIGDRHSYIRDYELPNDLFLPFIVAPLENKVCALLYERSSERYELLFNQYPYLTSINNIPIHDFLGQIRPKDVKAPKEALHHQSVKQLKYMAENYAIMSKEIPDVFQFTFSNDSQDTVVHMPLEQERSKFITWDDKFSRKNSPRRKELNNPEKFEKLFHLDEDDIAYMRIPKMVDQEDAPLFFEKINDFMTSAKESHSLIVDVRSNSGGTRHLIQELAGYFIHPDSVYVVNATRQRAELPLNEDWKEDLHNRFLFSRDELDDNEKKSVDEFLTSFKPMYDLDDEKFSEFHFFVLNSKKKSQDKYFYDRPIYILANERTFSAASILVSVFKGIRNIKIVGVKTDGSSGNSERFQLPKSKLRGKLSTMVSFQKNGLILDGIGTEPDIEIERNLNQIYWKEDYQLDELKRRIEKKYNPGHYVAVGPHFDLSEIKHLEESALRGVNKRYLWRTLEPEKDQYDFSFIEEDLDYCSKHNKKLIVFLCDRSFWIKGALPAYLKEHEWNGKGTGFIPMRWHPEFIQRFNAIGNAIADRFDAHPNFEGIAIQETALDFPEEEHIKYGYSTQKYSDALHSILYGLSNSFSKSNVFWYQNGIQGNNTLIREIADALSHRDNIIMGGPDILPHRKWLRYMYRIYGDYKDKMKLFCSAQDDSYHHHKNDIRYSEKLPIHEEGYLTMEEIFLYARDNMHVQYLFWNYYYEGTEIGERSFDDAMQVVREHPSLILMNK